MSHQISSWIILTYQIVVSKKKKTLFVIKWDEHASKIINWAYAIVVNPRSLKP